LYGTLDTISSQADLDRFSQRNGAAMPTHWPEFREYAGGAGFDQAPQPRQARIVSTVQSVTSNATGAGASAGARRVVSTMSSEGSAPQQQQQQQQQQQAAGTPISGFYVRALYDYAAQDDDELSFRENEYIWQTSSVDENGWARGICNGVEVCLQACGNAVESLTVSGAQGLFPANYVEVYQG
jgi:protein kinase C and casein kinase substrate in neurons protein